MNYEGIEIGAVSVKWARLSTEEMVYRNLKKEISQACIGNQKQIAYRIFTSLLVNVF